MRLVTSALEAAAIVLVVVGVLILAGLGWAAVVAGLGLGVYAWRLS